MHWLLALFSSFQTRLNCQTFVKLHPREQNRSDSRPSVVVLEDSYRFDVQVPQWFINVGCASQAFIYFDRKCFIIVDYFLSPFTAKCGSACVYAGMFASVYKYSIYLYSQYYVCTGI